MNKMSNFWNKTPQNSFQLFFSPFISQNIRFILQDRKIFLELISICFWLFVKFWQLKLTWVKLWSPSRTRNKFLPYIILIRLFNGNYEENHSILFQRTMNILNGQFCIVQPMEPIYGNNDIIFTNLLKLCIQILYEEGYKIIRVILVGILDIFL